MTFDLAERSAPWAFFAPENDTFLEKRLSDFAKSGGLVKYLDARNMVSESGLYRELARVLMFPSYFGHNWDAVVDCLDDLHGDWHGGTNIVAVVDRADRLLTVGHLPLLVSVLCQGAERANASEDEDGDPLNRPAIALHFIFYVSARNLRDFESKLRPSGRKVAFHDPYIAVS